MQTKVRIVELLEQGYGLWAIATQLNLPRNTVVQWVRRYRRHGDEGLVPVTTNREYSLETKAAAAEAFLAGRVTHEVPQRPHSYIALGYREAMPSKLAVITIDAIRPQVVADFWCAVLGWHVVESDSDIISIAPQDESRPSIDVVAVPEGKTIKNRLHFDLRADEVSTAEELKRLLALGARRRDVGQGPDVSWVVLGDPEGNEFCLLSRSVQDLDQD